MARVRASITVECPYRAAHGAVIVRLVQVAPAARPRTHTQSAHAATASSYKYRRSPPCHGRARTHPRAHPLPRTHTNAHTHAEMHRRTECANTQLAVNAESRAARAESNGAHVQLGTRAIPLRRVGVNVGANVGSGVATADRTRARMHLRYRTQSGDDVTHR